MKHYHYFLALFFPLLLLGASCTQQVDTTNTSTTNVNTVQNSTAEQNNKNTDATESTLEDMNANLAHETVADTSEVHEDWQTYINYNFSIQYPKDWTITRNKDSAYGPNVTFLSSIRFDNPEAEPQLDNNINFAVTDLELKSITNQIENLDIVNGETLAKVSPIQTVKINNHDAYKGSHATAIGISTNFYYIPLSENDKALLIFYHDLDEIRTSINEQIIQTLQLDDIDHLVGSSTDRYNCFLFINNHRFIDPNAVFYINNIEPLRQLTEEWEYGRMCESTDNSNVFVIYVNKPAESNTQTKETLDKTIAAYTLTSDEVSDYRNNEGSSLAYYHFYLFTDRRTELSYNATKKYYEAGQLISITELVWNGSLAGCFTKPGNYIADQGVMVSCGQGDNGCSEEINVKWNLLTGEPEYLNTCTNNCDLAEDEAYTLSCQA